MLQSGRSNVGTRAQLMYMYTCVASPCCLGSLTPLTLLTQRLLIRPRPTFGRTARGAMDGAKGQLESQQAALALALPFLPSPRPHCLL